MAPAMRNPLAPNPMRRTRAFDDHEPSAESGSESGNRRQDGGGNDRETRPGRRRAGLLPDGDSEARTARGDGSAARGQQAQGRGTARRGRRVAGGFVPPALFTQFAPTHRPTGGFAMRGGDTALSLGGIQSI
ncbi:hypothetical protein GLA29479_1656 [Lysobacter antibioticus]|uniref:Uncharacterized protein n=1 Tax=Lysobacter antibioticus TaxID=84531 RepID=A0A0S2DVG7_LYSAN|nr:hypothetical protein GLA29479_1656 [Lysobacter antibioticus]ALN80318.1 hypothetical protein LA76x_2179 [Lysobacter antibioticus]